MKSCEVKGGYVPWEKNFDREQALGVAVDKFWSCGFEATSMTSLLEAMQINRGSFYDTYGSKHALLLEAIDRYVGDRGADFRRLAKELSPREAIQAFIDWIVSPPNVERKSWGCMALNLALELAPSDEEVRQRLQNAFSDHRKYFRDLIDAGKECGDFRSDLDSLATARSLLAMVFGMRVFGRMMASDREMRSLANQAMKLLD